jgi:hypothetical protein
VPRNPIVGSFLGCCARAASGHPTAAPPSSVMNSRRPIRSPRRRQLSNAVATLATRLRLTPSSKLDKRTPTDGELPVV